MWCASIANRMSPIRLCSAFRKWASDFLIKGSHWKDEFGIKINSFRQTRLQVHKAFRCAICDQQRRRILEQNLTQLCFWYTFFLGNFRFFHLYIRCVFLIVCYYIMHEKRQLIGKENILKHLFHVWKWNLTKSNAKNADARWQTNVRKQYMIILFLSDWSLTWQGALTLLHSWQISGL